MANSTLTALNPLGAITDADLFYDVQSAADFKATRAQITNQIKATGLSAAGTVIANATLLTAEMNEVTTVNTNTGVQLPTPATPFGKIITVANAGANSLNVYPPSSGQINALGANTAFMLPAGQTASFHGVSATQLYSEGGGSSFTLFDTQTFTANGNWSKPSGAVLVLVDCIGGGGQGGGGRGSNAGVRQGGGGGGGGARVIRWLNASDLASTETVVVGAAVTSANGGSSADGTAGTAGNVSKFGTTEKVWAYGGGGGGLGSSATTRSGGAGGGVMGTGPNGGNAAQIGGLPNSASGASGMGGGGAGAPVNNTGQAAEWGGASGGGQDGAAAANGFAGGVSLYGGGGGGAGGGYDNTTARNGGTAGNVGAGSGTGSGGGPAGGNGGAGTNIGGTGTAGNNVVCGTGGGGGGGSSGSTGGAGGAGGIPGGGGGGGGGGNTVGGAGGQGARGEVRVYSYK